LNLDPDAVRRQGVGQLLGRVMDSQAFEALALNGGLMGLGAGVGVAVGIWVLRLGGGGGVHVVALSPLGLVAGATGAGDLRRLSGWTRLRIGMTHELIERMVGHRTTLAQEWPNRRDEREDRATKDYLNASAEMDRAVMPFLAGIPGGWMLIGLVGLAPAF